MEQCVLCTDEETFENPILNCVDCDLKVHVLCYGIENLDAEFKCSPCQSNVSQSMCILCMKNGGALKKTTCDGWVHVLCALFIEGCRFLDNNVMEPVDISRVSESKRNKKCCFCENDDGFAPLCHHSKCKNRLHITCAQKSGCLKEEADNNKKIKKAIKFRAYCLEHKPANSSRRISSEFVRIAALKKGKELKEKKAEEKKEKEASSNQSGNQWLIEKSLNQTSSTQKRKNEQHLIDSEMNRNGVNETETQRSKQRKISDGSSLLDWDSSKIKSLTPSMEDIFANKENFHSCYKDERILKVSKNRILIYFSWIS